MLTIAPTGVVRGIDVARPLREPALGQLLLALGNQGVLRLPDQHRDLGMLKGRIPVSCGSCGTVESVLCTVMLEDVSHVLGPLRWLVQTHTD